MELFPQMEMKLLQCPLLIHFKPSDNPKMTTLWR